MGGQTGLFDLQDPYAELSESGDPLERLLTVVDFEVFRAALGRKDRPKGGRPPMDAVMMFKILVLQALYGLSDEQAEYQVRSTPPPEASSPPFYPIVRFSLNFYRSTSTAGTA